MNSLVPFILSHNRADRVFTYRTLRNQGYTGRIVIIVDDQDPQLDQYLEKYKDEVVLFSKAKIAGTFDVADNFNNYRSVVYARNASFEIAKSLGIKYFIQLDDDYGIFQFRFDNNLKYNYKKIGNLDVLFEHLKKFFISSGALSVAISQGGDFIGGSSCQNAQTILLKRKLMNFWICSADKPFKILGRMNDDVNTYVKHGNVGHLFFTTNQISLGQAQTQTNPGGLTELYLDMGTYVKSFYTVLYQPSSVKVKVLRDRDNSRLHHAINWKYTVPKILSEALKKQ